MQTLPPSAAPFGVDYVQALAKIRGQRRNLGLLVILALLTQVTLWLLVKYDVIEVAGLAASVDGGYDLGAFDTNGRILHFVFGLTTFLAFACSLMLTVVLVIQALLLLQDRRTGVAKTTSAAGGALLLTVLCLPWQVFFQEAVHANGYVGLPGVTMLFSEVASYGVDEPAAVLGKVLHWGRFLAWPLFALLVAAVVLSKSGKPTKVAAEEAEAEDEVEGRLSSSAV